MPRDGSGIYSYPPNGDAVTATPIGSNKYNARSADVLADMNAARPIPAGGTGALTAVGANDALNTTSTAIASAATADLSTATGVNVTITGTVAITSFGTVPSGALRQLTFAGILTLTNSAALVLPGAANIVTAAGDTMSLRSNGLGNWTCVGYQRASGQPLSTAFAQITDSGALELTGIISPAALTSGSNNDYNPTGFATATVLRLSGDPAGSILTGLAARNSGTLIYLINVSSNPITLLPLSSSSLSANQFRCSSPFTLTLRQGATLWYDLAAGGWRVVQTQVAPPTAVSRKNLKIVTTSITAGTITADELVLEDASGNTYRATAVSQSYATGTAGAGGLDTGAMSASHWYYEWLIYNSSANTLAALISLSSTAPTMPSGYTFMARVGAIYYDAGAKLRFKIQYDRRVQYVVGTNPTALPQMASGSAGSLTTPTWVAVAVGAFVPTTAAVILLSLVGAAGSDATGFMVAPNNTYGAYTSSTNPAPFVWYWTNRYGFGNVPISLTLESSNIYWASNNSSGVLAVTGYEDNL